MNRLIFIWAVMLAMSANGQNAADKDALFKQAATIPTGEVNSFTIDNLGNFYIITPVGYLKKLNAKGDSLNVFNDIRRYGGISLMDVTNPLKILLYYRDFSTVLMLDRFLNQLNTIDLRKSGIFQAKAVGLSYDNNLWVYDEQAARLKKIDEEGKLMMETVDLRQVLTVVPSPEKLIDRDGFVYLYDKKNGLYVFDYYGMIKNELPITGLENVQVMGTIVVGIQGDKFIRYSLGDIQTQEAVLPPFIQNPSLKVIASTGIYVYTGKEIIKYTYQ